MPTHPKNVAVWFEIPVSDLGRAVAFYNKILDQQMEIDHNQGPNPIAPFAYENGDGAGTGGHLYPGKPNENGPTIHLAAPDSLEATRARIFDAGGKVESDDIPLPAGAFFYARDLDGNSIGLFSPQG